MKKLRRKQILAFVLAFVLCLGAMPVELFGGIAKVSAAESSETVDEIVRTVDDETNTTTWDFTKISADSNNYVGKTTLGLTTEGTKSSSVGLKKGYIRVYGPRKGEEATDNIGKLILPLDTTTTSVELTVTLTGTGGNDDEYGTRYVKIGNDTSSVSVYHKATDVSGGDCPNNFASGATWTGTFEADSFTGNSLVITGGVGETKIGSIKIVETKSAAEEVEMQTVTESFKLTDGTLVPAAPTVATVLSSGQVSLTLSDTIKYHNDHGCSTSAGTITMKVYGDTTIYLGGCQYSSASGTGTLTANGVAVEGATALPLKLSACGKNDEVNAIAFAYTGGEAELVLSIEGGSCYIPFVKVVTEVPKPDVELIDVTESFKLTDGTLVPAAPTAATVLNSGLVSLTLSDAIKYHNDHGCSTSAGTITMKVYGDTTIYLGGCQYSSASGTGTLTANGVAVEGATALPLKLSACGKNDEANAIEFKYTGEEGVETELVLTISGGSCYIPFIKVATQVPKPEWSPIEVPVSIGTGSDVLGSDSVTLTNTMDATDTHTVTAEGATLTLRTETTYKLTTENEKIKATVGGEETFKTGTEAAAVAIDVESLVVNPVVACDGLAEGKKLTLTYDTDKTIDLTVGQAVELWIGKEYSVSCDDETVEARVNDATSFKAAADMTELKVELLSLTNKVAMTVNGNLGDAKVIMTNVDDATDKVEFGNGDTVELKLNATYTISCSNEDLFALVAGKAKYTVATAISALTIDITAAEYHTYDVWDFGADQLESTKYDTYKNHLTEDVINGLYPGVAAGTTGKNIASFTVDGMSFDDGGYPTTHRWRSINGNLTRYDGTANGTDRMKKDIEGNVYRGFIYSNKSNTSDVNLSFEAKAGDIFKFMVGSNSNPCTYAWATTPGAEAAATFSYTKAAGVEEATFYATEDATYYLWVSSDEKLVVARATKETPNTVTVSGKLTIPAGSDMVGGKLVFTQYAPDGTKLADIEASITANDSYSVQLAEQYTYAVSLADKNGYIVDTKATADGGEFTLTCSGGNQTVDVAIVAVDLVTLSGKLSGLSAEEAAKLEMTFAIPSDKVYIPTFTLKEGTNEYTLVVEKDVETTVKSVTGVDDYSLKTAIFKYSADSALDIVFEKKPVYAINVTLDGPSADESKNAKYTFSRLTDALDGTLDGYVYNFAGTDTIELRDGQYKVEVALDGYTQQATSDVKVSGAAVAKTIAMKAAAAEVAYKEEITVGTSGDYQTINDALDAVRNMTREDGQRVTISIEPGNYEEMLYVDVENVTLKNAAGENASIELTNKGVDIAENAVRITGYYGHGYSYYSMDDNYGWNADVLAANKENGYESVANPGSGSATMWNATVRIYASGFQAEGIIFENSFNQYMSKKATEDVIVKLAGAKEGTTARSAMQVGDVTLQQKTYVERAAALAMGNNLSDIVFDNCKFIGRQDTLYGGTSTYVEFNECSIYGACDYIFGGMVAIFDKCDLVMNTSEDKNDVAYITAAQQKSGRGYFMNECHITSTTPGVDTASTYTSKPGYFGRPWQATTSEVVFYKTTIDAADAHWGEGLSLIVADGWNSTLGGTSAGMYEYGTVESAGVDNSASRVDWATMLTEEKLNDGVYITKDAFRQTSAEGLYNIDISKGLKAGVNYDGGLSVLEDMAMKTEGFVQGTNNPKDANGSSAKDYAVPATGAAVKIVAQEDGRFKVALKSAAGKDMYWVDADSSANNQKFQVATNETKVFALEKGHTYYLYGNGTKVCMYSLSIDYRPYVDWASVDAPTVGTPVVAAFGSENEGTITIPYAAAIGSVYSDSMSMNVYCDGELVDTFSITDETDPLKGYESSCTYTPEGSGSYTFKAVLRRSGTAGKNSEMSTAVDFLFPMPTPVIVNVENQGGGAVKFSWQEVNEAESYEVYLNGELKETVTVPYYRFTGLTVGTEYTFGVIAIGNGDKSEMSSMKETVSGDAQKTWIFSAFGQGVDTSNNKLLDGIDGADDTSLSLQSQKGKGKIVPASTDGLAFYYTTIDPSTENFTLSADITVDSWTLSNGQEGFGIMAADAVGTHGDNSVFWNNSYMAIASKVEYYWNDTLKEVASGGTKYSMKLGIGSMERIGVTQDNMEAIAGGNLTDFLSSTKTLENYAATSGNPAGTYNIVGNYTNDDSAMGTIKSQTTFHMSIQRNNTGYLVSYTNDKGQTTTNKYYHGENGDALTQIDPNNIYVGFFASRYATITVDNVSLTTINPADDAPAEERPITYVNYSSGIESSNIANSSDYELVYYGTADGALTIKQGETVIADKLAVVAEQKYRFDTKLKIGENQFDVEFTPDPDFAPSKYERLNSYKTITYNKKVTYESLGRNVIYVDGGKTWGCTGTKEDPMSIYEAVEYVKPGDVIIMLGGTYYMNKPLTIQRGIDGTEEEPIYLIADPDATSRPVLDFGGLYTGMVVAGDYWYLQGFDVTNSAPGQKGLQISGDNNVVDDIHAYRNGNTGIQISRFKGSDTYEDWPSNNLILNCTSYLNADPGYEDADGFAAKLTIADGNVFDGCIAAYNADDGWDLFAKIESGPIGKVTIKNCLAFKNGYDIDENGNEINAGNGNGFKMGGSSISGYHVLENSVAFANKAKGIDSNSCPDIQVINCTSFDNGSYNVAFYTNEAANTDYSADGVVSYKVSNTVTDSLKLKGSQDESKVYKDSNYYYLGKASQNNSGATITSDMFVSLDTDAAIHGGITRYADGTINMNGYLELNETSAVVQNMITTGNFFGATISGKVMNSGAQITGSADVQIPTLVITQNTKVDTESGSGSGSGDSDNSGAAGNAGATGTGAGAASSPKTSDVENSYVHSILWPETDSEQEATVEQAAEVEATDDVVIAGASLVQNAEENGINGMLIVIIVAVLALAAASGIVIFRKREEEM